MTGQLACACPVMPQIIELTVKFVGEEMRAGRRPWAQHGQAYLTWTASLQPDKDAGLGSGNEGEKDKRS